MSSPRASAPLLPLQVALTHSGSHTRVHPTATHPNHEGSQIQPHLCHIHSPIPMCTDSHPNTCLQVHLSATHMHPCGNNYLGLSNGHVSQARCYGFSLFFTQQPHGPHFKVMKQTQRGEVTCPRSHSCKVRN